MKEWFNYLAEQTLSPLQNSNAICALDKTGLLFVGGDDATEFLQNQLSHDIQLINPKRAQLSSLSTAKGRLLGIFHVIAVEGGYILAMPMSIVADIQRHLQKFIIMSKVVVADISDSFALFSIIADNENLIADEIFPAETYQVYQSDSLICIRLPTMADRNRFLILCNDAGESIDLWDQLSQNLTINDSAQWQLQNIEAGIPSIYPATSEAFVLQMCNLHVIDGVSFKKGCYPGQEIVARMQYLGKLKRRMYLAELSSPDCPVPGDELRTADSPDRDGSGKIVDAVQIKKNKCLMLFVAQIEKAENDQLVLHDRPEGQINIKPLPYSFQV